MADQIALRQAESNISAGSAHSITADFRTRSTGAASTPSSIRYRVDCLTNRQNIVNWTSVSAASSATITVAGGHNATIDDDNEIETRQLTVEIDTGLSTQSRQAIKWRVGAISNYVPAASFRDDLLLEPYYPIVAAETAAGLVEDDDLATNHNVQKSIRHGDTGDGTTNDRAALAQADSVGNFSITVGADYGTHLISSSLTFSNRVKIYPGEILKPANGVVITFNKWPDAHPSEQIFDLSAALTGLAIALPVTHDRNPVYAAWFGAIPAADGTKSNQQVELQYCIDSVDQSDQGGTVIKLAGGDYYCTRAVHCKNNTVLSGESNRTTNIRVSASWTDQDDYLVLFQRSTTAMFNARLENLAVRGGDDSFVTKLIFARGWNEHCGLKNVLVRDFMKYGLQFSDYYGGAATTTLDQVEFFASSSATDAVQAGINLQDPSYAEGWFQLLLSHIVCSGNETNGTTKFFAIRADGRVRLINLGGLHAEYAAEIIDLSGDASFEGVGPQATGNATVVDIFGLSSNWDAGDGEICCTPPRVGGATGNLLTNYGSGPDITTAKAVANPFVYPLANTRADSGAVSLRAGTTYITTTGAAAITLADGYENQEKTLVMTVDGGAATLTPTNLAGGTTITFDDVGDTAYLKFLNGEWYMLAGTATLA